MARRSSRRASAMRRTCSADQKVLGKKEGKDTTTKGSTRNVNGAAAKSKKGTRT